MLKLSYTRPITQEALPALTKALFRLKARIKRRRVLSAICSPLCFLLHTVLMSFTAVSLYFHQAGPACLALMRRIPYLPEADAYFFKALPESFGLRLAIPQLLGLGAAILLPLLVCLVVSLLVRLIYHPRTKRPLEENATERQTLALLKAETQNMAAAGKLSRKANWTLLSSFFSLVVSVAAIVWSLYILRPASPDLDAAYYASYFFIALIMFLSFFVAATLTDSLTAWLCALDTKWDGSDLAEDLLVFEAGLEDQA